MRRIEILVPGLLCLLAAALRLSLFSGLYGHDDEAYLLYTRSLLNGQTADLLHSLWGLRFPIWLPIVLSFKLLGVSYWNAFLPGFLLGLATVPIVYASIRILRLPIGIAALACLALVLNPIDWIVSTTIRGDIEMSFYGGALFLLLLCFRRARGVRRGLLGLAAGLVWGLSALTKEWGYVFAWGLFAVALLDAVSQRRLPWHYALIGAGFCAMLATDAVVLRILTGDWLARVHTSITWYQSAGASGDYAADLSTRLLYLPEILLGLRTAITSFGEFANAYPYFGPYMWLLLLALPFGFAGALPARPAAAFVAGVLLWIEFGSMSWSQYLPYHKEPRYLSMLSAPIAILIAVGGARIWQSRSRVIRGTAVALSALLSIVVTKTASANHREYVSGRDIMPALTDWLRGHPTARLWTRGSLQNELDLRFGYRFSDPAHHHRGSPGYGAVIDAGFWSLHRPGDFVLVEPDWPRFSAVYPAIERRKMKPAAALGGLHSTARIYEVMPTQRAGGSHCLSDDEPVRFTQEFGVLQWDRNVDGAVITLNRTTYDKGIGTHARSEIVFALDGRYRVFASEVGLDDAADGTRGSVVFAVYVDGALKGRSPVMRWNSPTASLRIDVTGASELTLVVEDGGDGNEWDHADWANPILSGGSAEPSKLLEDRPGDSPLSGSPP